MRCGPLGGDPVAAEFFVTCLTKLLNFQFFTDPEKVARDLQVKMLSRNLLRKYGLGHHKEQTEEQGGQVQGLVLVVQGKLGEQL